MQGFAKPSLSAVLVALATSLPATAAPPKRAVGERELTAVYAVSLAGLPLGQATLSTRLGGDRYESTLRASLDGLAGVLVGGEGKAVSKGRMDPEQPLPSTFELDVTYAGVPIRERMVLDAGIVRSVDITPKPEPRPDRVVVSQADRTGIVDPLSALIAPLRGAPTAASCDRTIPVYDGTMRFDLRLSGGEVASVADGPYRGIAVDCSARYVPVSGHRANRKAVRAMADNASMSVRLAPAWEGGPLVPLRISVDTGWGVAVVQAVSWTVAEGTARDRRAKR